MGGDAMTLLERLETLGEQLLHPHHEHIRADDRLRGSEDRHEHHVDQSAGSEFLDMM
jgi:hypothetical protein